MTDKPKPEALGVVPDGVPEGLTSLCRWVLWRYDRNASGEWAKTPYRPGGISRAASNRPRTWGKYQETLSAYLEGGGWAGIGFVFHAYDGLLGIDLDHCRDPATGRLSPHARAVLVRLNGYAEVSPSGTGVKAYVRARKPEGTPCVFRGEGGVKAAEVYHQGRYFAVTGRRLLGFPSWLADRQEEVDSLFAENFLVPRVVRDRARPDHRPPRRQGQGGTLPGPLPAGRLRGRRARPHLLGGPRRGLGVRAGLQGGVRPPVEQLQPDVQTAVVEARIRTQGGRCRPAPLPSAQGLSVDDGSSLTSDHNTTTIRRKAWQHVE